MPPVYWAEALPTATHLLNICPTKPFDLKTPHEALFSQPPLYDHLRVYGSLCYPNLSATIPHKLSARSVPCVFIGYTQEHKGYRCLDRESGRVYTSRHVTFDEAVFPFSTGDAPDLSDYDFEHASPNPLLVPNGNLSPIFQPTGANTINANPIPAAAGNIATVGCRTPTEGHLPATTLTAPTSNFRSPPTVHTPAASPIAFPPSPPGFPSPSPSTPVQPVPPSKPIQRPIKPPTHGMRTCAQDGIFQPRKLFNLNTVTALSPIPSNYRSALDVPHWSEAMRSEYSALVDNVTWQLVPKPLVPM
jgi:hypothetical protein